MFAFEIPAPKRTQKSMKALTAKPDRNTIAAKMRLHHPTIGHLLIRSAMYPSGTAPTTKNAVDTTVMKIIVPSLMPSDSPMSGPSTASAAPSSSSSELRISRMTNVDTPPLMSPCFRDISSSRAPRWWSRSSESVWLDRWSSSSWARTPAVSVAAPSRPDSVGSESSASGTTASRPGCRSAHRIRRLPRGRG